ncbi:hypothetical protein IWQ61_006220 [Dispira simplex]|nr:hypothetical protein IWQ61_006220 [Dispira simplex]
MAVNHTILLIQRGNLSSRTYYDYNSVQLAIEGLVRMYEERLKALHPTAKHINYHFEDLKKFVDNHGDMSVLVFDPATGAYKPHDRSWLKSEIYNHLKRLASC